MKAIDVHVHVPAEPGLGEGRFAEQMSRYFRSAPRPNTPEDMAATFKALDILGVIFTVDSESASGEKTSSNDWTASIVKKYPGQFIGFASVDPWKGKMAVKEIERCVKQLGLRGLKLMPNTQAFFPNDPQVYPIYDACQGLGIPVLIHSGTTGVGAGLPGGGGVKLKYSNPMYIDDVAADFPDLTIIMAHPGWPWQTEQLAVAVHKANAYIDLSGWSPKYFDPQLIQYANRRIPEKFLYGSDYPVLQPERWLKDFAEAPFEEAVRPKILLENAKRVLKL